MICDFIALLRMLMVMNLLNITIINLVGTMNDIILHTFCNMVVILMILFQEYNVFCYSTSLFLFIFTYLVIVVIMFFFYSIVILSKSNKKNFNDIDKDKVSLITKIIQ